MYVILHRKKKHPGFVLKCFKQLTKKHHFNKQNTPKQSTPGAAFGSPFHRGGPVSRGQASWKSKPGLVVLGFCFVFVQEFIRFLECFCFFWWFLLLFCSCWSFWWCAKDGFWSKTPKVKEGFIWAVGDDVLFSDVRTDVFSPKAEGGRSRAVDETLLEPGPAAWRSRTKYRCGWPQKSGWSSRLFC